MYKKTFRTNIILSWKLPYIFLATSIWLFLLICTSACITGTAEKSSHQESTASNDVPYALVIHGGAGTILKENMSDEMENAYREKLQEALDQGYGILDSGGSGMDAICTAINILEDSPLFNAGKGAVFTADGKNEMDASIMNGETLEAGAVGGLSKIKNPILAARAVMESSPHVMMVEDGADAFAESQGLEIVDPSYFHTEKRWKSLQKAKERETKRSDLGPEAQTFFSTVGAVALDKNGNLAAGTSTGGMTNKKFGRIGDSPIIGAGTYAENEGCAISATGHGEYFIRNVVAYDINARVKYQDKSLEEAAEEVIMKKLVDQNGTGGIIGIDAQGKIAMVFNTAGMYRGCKSFNGRDEVLIYK